MPAIVVTLALALSSPAHAQQELQRYALLVGDNDGGPSRVQLRYAHDDAAEMASVLTELGGVRDDQQQLLLDPTAASLDAAFADLAAKLADGAGARAEFVFYYSGHSDEQGLLLGDERYEYRALRARLEGMPARVRIAILDSCASGALILEKGGKPVEPFLVDESTQVGGLAYLTSSSADEAAQEAERIGGSFFTHYLASGLRGAADSSGDGRVTLYEAYSYAHQETLEHTETTQNGPQHAWYSNRLSGTGELVLTDLALTSASLVLDEALDGRALIRDADGNLVVELQKVAGRPIELGLAEGHYSVTLLSGPESYGEAQVELTTGASTLVQANELVWQASEVAVARGNLPPGALPPAALPPVALPPVAIVAPVEPPLDDNWFRFVVAPGMPAAEPATDRLVLGLIAGESTELSGMGLAFGWYNVQDTMHGLVATLGTTSVRQLDGLQASLAANTDGEGGTGGQLTVGANIATGDLVGAQLSVGANIATKKLSGVQLTAGGNFATGGLDGLQFSSGVNVLGGAPSTGVQAAMINVAHAPFEGLQLSLINVGQDVKGVQLGLINVGHDVSGTQIGLINVAHDVKGAPIGLLSFEKEGRHDLLVFASEADGVNAELRFGGDYLYTLVGGGGLPEHAYASFGLGAHVPFGKVLWTDLDALGATYIPLGTTIVRNGEVRGPFSRPPTQVIRARATIGLQLAKQFAPFVGASMNVRVPGDYALVDVAPGWYGVDGDLIAWPGAFAGVQF